MPVQSEKPLVAWSHSALEVFRTCPRKYYEAKISKAWPEVFKGPAAEFGKAVHKAFEQAVKFSSPFPTHLAGPGALALWQQLALRLGGMKGVIYLEQQIALNKALQKVEWYDDDVWCRTIIDYLCVNHKKARAMIWDYKTGKRKDDDRQLALMAAVTFEIHPEVQTIQAGYIWLKGDTPELYKVTFLRPYKGRLWNEYLPTVQALENAVMTGHWPEKRNGLCNGWCPVQDCQHWAPLKEK